MGSVHRVLPWIYGLLELSIYLSILHLMGSSVGSAMFLMRFVFVIFCS